MEIRNIPIGNVVLLEWNSEPVVTDQLIVKGQVFKLRTFHDLVLMIVRLRYEHGLNDIAKRKIIEAGRKCGLLSTTEDDLPYRGRGRGPKPSAKYWALLDDEAEKLARELTGWSPRVEGLCACGCGRVVRGRAKTATEACRKRMSRLVA